MQYAVALKVTAALGRVGDGFFLGTKRVLSGTKLSLREATLSGKK